MGLDIYLNDRKTGEEVMWLNWLRNPFGLCNWAQDTVHEFILPPPRERLWYVINHWSYAKSKNVNRGKFLEVVNWYFSKIRLLDSGYFFFDLPSYIQFIQGKIDKLPQENVFPGVERIVGSKYSLNDRLMIPMDYLERVCDLRRESEMSVTLLQHYKGWFARLVEFAESLQNPKYSFYCSN